MFGAALGLLICATAVNLPMLWVGTIIAGLFSVAAQILIPLATMAVRPENRRSGRFSHEWLISRYLIVDQYCRIAFRPVSLENHLCAQQYGTVGFGLLLKRTIAQYAAYAYQLCSNFKSMGRLLREEPRLGLRSLIGACAFAAMSMLFSTIALLLTQKPFHLSDVMVGLVTLVGVLVRYRLKLLANGRIVAISRS